MFEVNGRRVGPGYPTYFIADIAANHDGALSRAIDLIHLAKEAGADAAKFQHFRAESIVSPEGFAALGGQKSHQADWEQSVFEVYQKASIPWSWTEKLKAACDAVEIDFFSAPYDLAYIDKLVDYMPAYKVGSGDITWLAAIDKMAQKHKPMFMATGASTLAEVQQAVETVRRHHTPLCLMQCNTNYTNQHENFKHINLNVLKTYARLFPEVILGLSDHTPGDATVLGAVALGACAIEKHFTDDKSRQGPDHDFSMTLQEWRDMVEKTRVLEMALGHDNKTVEPNEAETVFLQRRCLRLARDIPAGQTLRAEDIIPLRPVASGAYLPRDLDTLVGSVLRHSGTKGQALCPDDIDA